MRQQQPKAAFTKKTTSAQSNVSEQYETSSVRKRKKTFNIKCDPIRFDPIQ